MPYRKATLRTMPLHTRELAKLINELQSITRHAKNLLPLIQSDEIEADTMLKHQEFERAKAARAAYDAAHAEPQGEHIGFTDEVEKGETSEAETLPL